MTGGAGNENRAFERIRAFAAELVGDGGEDTVLGSRFLKLSRAEKVGAQDSTLFRLNMLLKSFGYGIQNRGFAGASLTGQPEDTRAGR